MGQPYSEDLRLRVLEAIDNGLSKMSAHKTYRVSRSTIDDWMALRAATGGVVAQKPGGGNAPSIPDLQSFEEFAGRHCHATLEQMSVAWEKETGTCLSRNTFSLALRKIGWTHKKRVGFTASATKPSASSSKNS